MLRLPVAAPPPVRCTRSADERLTRLTQPQEEMMSPSSLAEFQRTRRAIIEHEKYVKRVLAERAEMESMLAARVNDWASLSAGARADLVRRAMAASHTLTPSRRMRLARSR